MKLSLDQIRAWRDAFEVICATYSARSSEIFRGAAPSWGIEAAEMLAQLPV